MATLQAPSGAQTFTTKGGTVWKPNASGFITGVNGQAVVELLQMGCTLLNNTDIGLRIATVSPVVLLGSDNIVEINLATPGACAVSLTTPAQPSSYTIYDGANNAGTNNVTLTPVSGNINGAATFVLKTNGQSATVTWDGTNWQVT